MLLHHHDLLPCVALLPFLDFQTEMKGLQEEGNLLLSHSSNKEKLGREITQEFQMRRSSTLSTSRPSPQG